ncbi:MAG: hypothetical protein LBL87_07325 [Ruminococcus sp.]|jgi:hypothetical protein|nr:hypothetical protein [Ruminococcus sp.]
MMMTAADKTKKPSSSNAKLRKTSEKQKTAQLSERTAAVEDALFRRAIGYSADEMTFSPEEDGERCVKIVRKEVAPSIQAQIQWLKAYKPEVWKNGGDTDPSDPALLYRALTGGIAERLDDDV